MASDNCSDVSWSHETLETGDACGGTTGYSIVEFTATDDCGNESSTTATFTIEDTTPPSVSGLGARASKSPREPRGMPDSPVALAQTPCSQLSFRSVLTCIRSCQEPSARVLRTRPACQQSTSFQTTSASLLIDPLLYLPKTAQLATQPFVHNSKNILNHFYHISFRIFEVNVYRQSLLLETFFHLLYR